MLNLFYLINAIVILCIACCEDKIYIIECEISDQTIEFETYDKPDDCWDNETKTWYVHTIDGYKIISDSCSEVRIDNG